MNETLGTIFSRRSIRSFTGEPVAETAIETLLRAAMAAPSAGNQQPWHFVVIRDRAVLDAIPSYHPHSQMCCQAPCAILLCADPALQRYPGFWVQDLSAATENLLLAAHALGLGAVWCGIHPDSDREEAFRRHFSLPSAIIPFALVPVGYPSANPEPADRFRIERVHRERWS